MGVTDGTEHPLRRTFSELMHLRTLPIAAPPFRVRQWLLLQNGPVRDATGAWLQSIGAPAEALERGRHEVRDAHATRIWEQHTEFATVTEVRSDIADDLIPDSPWLAALPGAVFRSIEVVVSARGAAPPDPAQFDPARLVSAFVFDGAARIWSDYSLKAEGAGRIWIEDLALANDEPARLVQTLLEVGNYRKLALLGFPEARGLLPWLSEAEERHATLARALTAPDGDDEALLGALTRLATEVEDRAAAIRFRMGATFAYQRLTLDRLHSLRETRIAGFSGPTEFIERRLLPAIRTCEVVDRRLTDLSERIARTCNLISLRQGLALERQNQAILTNMNRRADLQVRLQQLVEGFSVFALSYYVLGLIGYVVKPFGDKDHGAALWMALATPAVLALVWLGLSIVKRRVHTQVDD
ncbi:DUF3422 domain-containing protein [Sphingomonas sp. CJ99]